MSESVDIRSLDVLPRLWSSLNRFSEESDGTLRRLELRIVRLMDQADGVVQRIEREVRSAEARFERARYDLRACESRADDDYQPDCSCEEGEVHRARSALRRAEERLQEGELYRQRLRDAVERLLPFGRKYRNLLRMAVPDASQALRRISRPLEQYLESPLTSAGDAFPGWDGGPSSYSSMVSGKGSLEEEDVGSGGDSTWVERGIIEVSLDQLPEVEGVDGPEDFNKVSREEMEQGVLRLEEMSPTIWSGQGNSSDYWREFDKERGLEYARGYQRVYEAFYGNDCIRVNHDGSSWDIVNGRHRISVARRLGVHTLPVRLAERHS